MREAFKKAVVIVLTWEARLVLWRYKPRVIAITGSVGKTTTKDAIYAVISGHVDARKSQKTLNTEFGVPLTILGCESGWGNPLLWISNIIKGAWIAIVPQQYPKWLVLEVGADRPGDIRSLAKWIRPEIAVITAVSEIPVHVEFFPSPEALLREKLSLAEYLRPGGKLVLNADDPRLLDARSDFRGVSVTFGISSDADFTASHEEILYENGLPAGMLFRSNHGGSSVPVSIYGALGTPRVYAGIAAIAVANILGIDSVAAADSLSSWPPPPGRMRIVRGLRGSTLIDDTYNSSPAAALAALDTLKAIKTSGRKIALLADMLELGKYSADAHREVGVRAAECADLLLTVGFRARAIAQAALDSGMDDASIRQYEQNESSRAGLELEREVREGDVILIKGSQSMRMERAVSELMAEPQRASELLVRQEPEWLAKA